MTTEVIVSIPYIHPGDEVVIDVIDGEGTVLSEDIVRLVGVKKYTIWNGKEIRIRERRLTDNGS